MLLNPGFAKTLGVHFLSRSGLLKLNSFLKCEEISVKKIFFTSSEVAFKPLHTNTKLEAGLSCQVKPVSDKNDSWVDNYEFFQEGCNQEPHRTSEKKNHRYLTVINLEDTSHTSDLYCCDDFLVTQEFRNALSKSLFHYDVRLVNYIAMEQKQLWSNVYDDRLRHFLADSFNHFDVTDDNGLLHVEDANVGNTSQQSGPTEEQLLTVTNYLCYSLLNFFRETPDYSLYHKNVVFHNNIKGITTKGLSAYMQQMYLLKIYGHLHYAKVNVDILKITHHMDDGTVRVRWRVHGMSRSKILLLFWKLKDRSWEKFLEEQSEWLDGISVFSVDQDGLIFKHVCDKMIPDSEESTVKGYNLKSKLMILLGLSERSPVGNLNAMLAYSPLQQNYQTLNICRKTSDV